MPLINEYSPQLNITNSSIPREELNLTKIPYNLTKNETCFEGLPFTLFFSYLIIMLLRF
ncbi:MAG: hypothetical protein GY830_03590 [Bacteroidetes bacterium]|nr:hypothetical protein [Bacteroidota bacterium]